MDYNTAFNYFNNNKIQVLSSTDDGMRFLKLRSLARKNYTEYLAGRHSIDVKGVNLQDRLKIIYESKIQLDSIDIVIKELYKQERSIREHNEDQLLNELYKVQSFEWGGLHQNSLEKTIIDNYVKKICSYDSLGNAIENELHHSMRSYVLASWYNHWSSIIIEDIFKDHHKVIPAIGLIKKIDFFVGNNPFDLKVTYLPEGYIKDHRRSNNLCAELTLMKRISRNLNIGFDQFAPDSALIPDLWRKLDDHPGASELIAELQEFRQNLLYQAMRNPEMIARWLYENQGIRRFDASNRLFLVLVDKDNFFDSWKLKRAKPLISKNVNAYLDKIGDKIGFELDFNWENNSYNTKSDVIFIVK